MGRRKPMGGILSRRYDDTVEDIGCCVVCKLLIYNNQEHQRAPRPPIGKVHAWCIEAVSSCRS